MSKRRKGEPHGDQAQHYCLAASVYRVQISNSSVGIMNLASINLFPRYLTRQTIGCPDRHAESSDGFCKLYLK